MNAILFSYRRCPYAMRARMALAASGFAYEHREVDLANKPAALLAASAKGTVPVLVLENGQVLEQSLDIMRHALASNDPYNWLPVTAEGEKLIETNDTRFKASLNGYKYPERMPEKSPIEHRADGEWFLGELEHRLMQHTYLTGPTMNMADIAIFPFVRQFAKIDEEWFATCHHPRLRAWLEAITSSELFAKIMHKYEIWQPNDGPIVVA